jgi:predicted transcriptional regulator
VTILKRVETCKLENDALEDQIVASLKESIASELEARKAFEVILAVMNECHESTKITTAVFQCLVTLSIESPIHRDLISKDVLNSVIVKLTKMVDSAPLIIHGCDFLARMASDDNVRCRTAIIQAGACKAIVGASRRHLHNAAVQRAITCVLRLLSEEFDCWFELQQPDANPLREILRSPPG